MPLTPELRTQIQQTIESTPIVVFMKGTKNFPQCGFSAAVVHALKGLGAEFKDVNVLADAALREGIKEFSSWPTIPQVYIDGKFVGGSDIVREMLAAGELEPLVKEALAKGTRQ